MDTNTEIKELTEQDYKYGFTTTVETDTIPRGLSEEVIRLISAKKMSLSSCWNFVLKLIDTG
jgi:Fe-S cluster assembly protein SufB